MKVLSTVKGAVYAEKSAALNDAQLLQVRAPLRSTTDLAAAESVRTLPICMTV